MSGSLDEVRLHPAELDRLDSLASYGVLDTPPETAFDALTALAARVCGTPLAAISFIDADRQWFKSTHGLQVSEIPRSMSLCADAVADGGPLVVPDTIIHPRYCVHPLVTGKAGIRAYAGVPLIGRDGLPLGGLCVLDRRARRFSCEQLQALNSLANQVVALLEQRRQDRSQGLFAEPVLEPARDPVRLRQALDAGELVPHFQPLVDIHTGTAYGLEALLRWEHPQLGVLAPCSFLPAIEASALVVPVGRAVLGAALDQLAKLRQASVPLPGGVAVNVASGQLARPGLARDVLTMLQQRSIPAAELALEITEATALPDRDLACAELGALADAGVHIVIDDFGVGWSNLARILKLPVDALKLDRSIAAAVLDDRRAAAMVHSTTHLAADLGLRLIAEGVESEAVRKYLADAGCGWAQGWLFGAAVPGPALPNLLRGLQAPTLPVPRRPSD